VLIGRSAWHVACCRDFVLRRSASDGVVSLHGQFSSDQAQSVTVYRGEGDAPLIRLATINAANQSTFEYADRTATPGNHIATNRDHRRGQ
jgi:hypothetical protein